MAGYRETFGGNVDYAYGRGVNDIGNRLQSGMSSIGAAGKGISDFVGQARGAQRSIKDLGNTMSQLRNEIANATDPQQIRKLTREFENARAAADKFKNQLKGMPFDALEKGLGRIVKSLLSFNTGLLSLSFDFIIDSIKRVYELQEKWTRAIGGFNMKIGGMSAGLKGATTAAVKWSSTVRSLTNGDITEGIQIFEDFTEAIGRTVQKGDAMEKWGLTMARGFNLGGSAAGKLSKSFDVMGDNADDVAETMKGVVKGANAAGVPVNILAKGLAEGSTYMTRFGKDSQKTFVEGAAFASKFRISVTELQKSVEGFDAFDEAAKSASKLNTAFGTMINSMDLMMEDDPAKRLESIRQQMLAQGMTYDKLTPKQRRYFSETMKLSEDQTAALLDSKNANMSYADFQAKAEKKEKQELTAKQMMQKQLQATAQTMYAFGQAFDRVTLAIGKAIKPLLEVLGLAKKGDKDFKGFGDVMEGITDTVVKFFESLAGNDRWMDFMKELGKDLQRAGSALKEFVLSGRAADWVGDLAKGMKSFYVTVRDLAIKAAPMLKPLLDIMIALSGHIKELAIAWAGMKAFNFANNAMGGGLISKIGGGLMGGGIGGTLGRAGLAGGLGYAVGGKGAGIGAGIGSIAGKFLGPLGMVLGPIVGGFIGKGIEMLFSKKEYKTQIQRAEEDLADTIKREEGTRAGYEAQVESFTARQKADDIARRGRRSLLQTLEKQAMAAKGHEVTLTKEQASALSEHSSELALFTKSTKISKEQLDSLGDGSRLTADQLRALVKGSDDYETSLGKLRDTSEQILKQQQAQLEVSGLGTQKSALEAVIKSNQADILAAQQQGAGKGSLSYQGQKLEGKQLDEMLDRFDQAMEYQTDPSKFDASGASGIRAYLGDLKKLAPEEKKGLEAEALLRKKQRENIDAQKKLQLLQTNFVKEQSIIQIRALEMSSGRFLEYTKSHPQLTDPAAAFESYLKENQGSLEGLYGKTGYQLLSQRPDFELPKMATGGVVTRPTKAIIGEAGPEAVIPLSRLGGTLTGGQVVTQIADVHLDGQKVGRAIVRTAIRGRN